MNKISFYVFCTLLLICVLSIGVFYAGKSTRTEVFKEKTAEKQRFEQLKSAKWKEAFFDSCERDWKDRWFLDGLNATITNNEKGMDFYAGPQAGDDSHHAVLWTRQSFQGDVKIEYEYTRLDTAVQYVNILYIQATGSGQGPYDKDISSWASLRTVPSMPIYFNNMNTYHVSYAAFGQKNTSLQEDYIRARRYMPVTKKGLEGTKLEPDYLRTGLFETGVLHKITVIKKGNDLYMQISNDMKQMLCYWRNTFLPPIQQGRIGLRHMYTRDARYRNFRVSVLRNDFTDSVE